MKEYVSIFYFISNAREQIVIWLGGNATSIWTKTKIDFNMIARYTLYAIQMLGEDKMVPTWGCFK